MKGKRLLAAVLTACMLLSLLPAVAPTTALAAGETAWSVTNENNVFTISRSGDTSKAESVYYRTVSLSAVAGDHFTAASGTLDFAAGETSKSVTVNEKTFSNVPLRSRFQTTSGRSYRFEVLDTDGFRLAAQVRSIDYAAGQFNDLYLNKSVSDLIWFSIIGRDFSSSVRYKDVPGNGDNAAYRTVTDDGYDQGFRAFNIAALSQDISSSSNVNEYIRDQMGGKLYAAVGFTQKEEDDGYQYIQIYTGQSGEYDGDDPEGAVNTPSRSLYKACFELSKSDPSVVQEEHNQFFPHRYGGFHSRYQESRPTLQDHTEYEYADSYLYEQKFKSGYMAEDAPALMLDPTTSTLFVRLDAGGYGEDDWYYKNIFARCAIGDATAPTMKPTADIIVSPGPYAKGNELTVSLVFNEIVKADGITGASVLRTNWGDLYPVTEYLGTSNVITFTGMILSGTVGSTLQINGLSNVPVTDLVGNLYTGGSFARTYSSCTLAASRTYTISYDLGGGALPEGQSNPASYIFEEQPITLVNPVREGYGFTGWTGTGLAAATMSVTIPTFSHGDRVYTATWMPLRTVTFDPGNGDAATTQSVAESTKAVRPADPVREGYSFRGWFADGAVTAWNFNDPVAADMTLRAQWAWNNAAKGAILDVVGNDGFSDQGPAKLLDGDLDSKWCLPFSGSAAISFRTSRPIAPVGYLLATANDTQSFPARNPDDWTLEGRLTESDAWTVLASVSNDTVLRGTNFIQYRFPVDNAAGKAYRYFRLTVSGTNGESTMQLGELWLLIADSRDYHTITWADGDGNTIMTDSVADGTVPVYTGETPTKASANGYRYVFTGWDPIPAAAAGDATYTAQFEAQEIPPISVTSSTTEWTDGNIYVVDGTVTIPDRISVSGSVTLQLNAGCTLNASQGIKVEGGQALTINGSGTLNATGGSYQAGIGGNLHAGGGTVIINGGTVNASGGSYGAGIGGGGNGHPYAWAGEYGSGGSVTINGGVVTATGGLYAAGIGGGGSNFNGESVTPTSGGSLTFNGGRLTATGGNGGYGVGPGMRLEVPGTGGTITLGWTNTNDFLDVSSYGGSITFADQFKIYGTDTIATAENAGGHKIVPIDYAEYTITWLNEDGSLLGTDTVAGGVTPVYTGETPAKASADGYDYVFAGWSPVPAAADGDATYTAQFRQAHAYTITWLNEDGSLLGTDRVEEGVTPVYTGETPAKASAGGYDYVFTGWDPAPAAVTGDATYTAQFEAQEIPPIPVTASTTSWEDGCTYAVSGEVTISDRIIVNGSVTLLLGEGAVLNARKGIKVQGTENSLTINGSGTLNASADKGYAAIGGDWHFGCGTVVINGGTINATGGAQGAAIGGGANNNWSSCDGYGGNVTINGGVVNAVGGRYAAAIGGGGSDASWSHVTAGRGGTLVVNGGQVTAVGVDGYGVGPGTGPLCGDAAAGTTTLSLTNNSDFIEVSSFGGTLTINGLVLEGTDTAATAENAGGSKLVPATAPVYTVSFDANGGGTDTTTAIRTTGRFKLPECGFTANTGLSFDCWRLAGTDYAPGDVCTVSADTTFTAVWVEESWVIYDANGGTGTMESARIESGTEITLPVCGFTAPQYMEFDCWRIGGTDYAPGDPYTLTDTVTITAVWKAIRCVVTFETNGGTGTMDSVTENMGTTFVLPACTIIPPAGMKFGYWVKDGVNYAAGDSFALLSDATLTPYWIDEDTQYYTVTYYENGGTGTMEEAHVPFGEDFVLPECTFTRPADLAFAGWLNGGLFVGRPGDTLHVVGDITLSPRWRWAHTVTFYANGGTGTMEPLIVADSESFDLPDCTFTAPEGMMFQGWKIAPESFGYYNPNSHFDGIGDDFSLYAYWVPLYVATFDANGGTGTMESMEVGYFGALELPECTFTPPAGKHFVAWQVSGWSGTHSPGDRLGIDESVTVAPVWVSSDNYWLAYLYPNGGSGWMPCAVIDNNELILPECAFTPPEGKVFKCWKREGKEYEPGIPYGFYINFNTAFDAVWANVYTVGFDPGEGTGEAASVTARSDKPYTLPACTFTAPEGKMFRGWAVGETIYTAGASVMLTGNTTFTASWGDPGNTVTFIPDNGGNFEVVAPVNSPVLRPADPVKAGYTFLGWYVDGAAEAFDFNTPVTEGLTLRAAWAYTGLRASLGTGGASYDQGISQLFDGTDKKWCVTNFMFSAYVEFNADDFLLPTGYVFVTGEDTATYPGRNPKSWTLQAKHNASDSWTTIASVSNDTVMQAVNDTAYRFAVSSAAPENGYRFFRLNITGIGSGDCFQLKELYLLGTERLEPATYTLTFDSDDGTDETFTRQCADGGQITMPACPFEAPDGYIFFMWENEDGERYYEDDWYTVTGNMTFTPVWSRQHTVTLLPNNGTDESFTEQWPEAEPFVLPELYEFGYLGFTIPDIDPDTGDPLYFAGWTTVVDGETQDVTDEFHITGDITFTAKWRGPSAWDRLKETVSRVVNDDTIQAEAVTIKLTEDIFWDEADSEYLEFYLRDDEQTLKTFILDLNGHVIDVSGGDYYYYEDVIDVYDGATLIICDSAPDGGGAIRGGDYGVYVYSDGALILESGEISGFASNGVYVGGETSFTMNGGTIAVNEEDGVYVSYDASFTMTGGTIADNEEDGVCLSEGADFTMTGGTIADNEEDGVYVSYDASFTMTGGTISGNLEHGVENYGSFILADGVISGNGFGGDPDTWLSMEAGLETSAVEYGGGVYSCTEDANPGGGILIRSVGPSAPLLMGGELDGGEGNIEIGEGGEPSIDMLRQMPGFLMLGGEISGNIAGYEGGGVYAEEGIFEMRGGTIAGNKAESGGGVYAQMDVMCGLFGGTITGNAALELGGGAAIPYVSIGGDIVIDGNFSMGRLSIPIGPGPDEIELRSTGTTELRSFDEPMLEEPEPTPSDLVAMSIYLDEPLTASARIGIDPIVAVMMGGITPGDHWAIAELTSPEEVNAFFCDTNDYAVILESHTETWTDGEGVEQTETYYLAALAVAYPVTYRDGETTYTTQYVAEERATTAPEAPEKDGFTFLGWTLELPAEGEAAVFFDFDTIIEGPVTLYAVWGEAAATELAIVEQPADVNTPVNQTVAFEVTATGDGLTYQWQYKDPGGTWTNWADKMKSRMTCVAVATRNGRQVRCVVTDSYGNTVTSEAATIIIGVAPTITGQPADLRIAQAGERVEFTVIATGEGLSYQWEYRDVGGEWTTWADKTKSVLSFNAIASRNGRQVRCVVTNESGTATSEYATLTIGAAVPAGPEITSQPVDLSITEAQTNSQVAFEVVATGEGLTYQWQYKDGGGAWTNWADKTKSLLTFNAIASRSGRQVRCVITDASGNTVTSDAATLTIGAAVPAGPEITSQPVDLSITEAQTGSRVEFEVVATGDGLTYQWQYKDGEGAWTNWADKTKSVLTFNAIASRNGRQVRCVITDEHGMTVTSDAATLTITAVQAVITITSQPVDLSITEAQVNSQVAFEVVATGEGLTYQWQYKDQGGAWTNWADKTKSRLTFNAIASRNGRQVRCVITDEHGITVTSEVATLTIGSAVAAPVITSQPVDLSITEAQTGSQVAFEVVATGEGLTYQWQYKDQGGAWTTWTDKTKSRLTFNAIASRNGRQVRCVITDASGNTVTSAAATLTIGAVQAVITITSQPVDLSITEAQTNSQVAFEVVATGEGLSYQWQYKDQGGAWTTWTDKTKSLLTFNAIASRNGRQVRCVITDNYDNTVTSDAATLTIGAVQAVITITSQPVDLSITEAQTNSQVAFEVVATGEGLSYQWQYKDGGGAWTNWADKTKSLLTFNAIASRNGRQVRCVITDASGNTVTSAAATLTIG